MHFFYKRLFSAVQFEWKSGSYADLIACFCMKLDSMCIVRDVALLKKPYVYLDSFTV